MKAAIYARYSSENQSEKSIEDQIRVCQKHAQEKGLAVNERHIYADEAISGTVLNRPGLQALEEAAAKSEFKTVLVDDLSRLSRSNHQMLSLVLKFNFWHISIISVSDGINTEDENAKLGIQLRGLVNELYLDDLRKKTMRGLEGQKLRGFSAGERVYGYSSLPSGEIRLRSGTLKHEGMIHQINLDEASVVQRIFKEFSEHKSINKIVRIFNQERIPSKRCLPGGWNQSSISRILQNQKYIGHWDWRKTKSVQDPVSGQKKSLPRPAKERIPIFREDLIIVGKELWDKVQQRRKEIQGAWPVAKNSGLKQRSYVHAYPIYPFSGLMKCGVCKGGMVLVSGRRGGYYGCLNARRKTCGNRLTIQRLKLERIILSGLRETILTEANLNRILQARRTEADKRKQEFIDLLATKRSEQTKLTREIENYIGFIKAGNFSKTVTRKLEEAEKKSESLEDEIKGLIPLAEGVTPASHKDRLKSQLEALKQALGGPEDRLIRALRDLLDGITLEPTILQHAHQKRYVAHLMVRWSVLFEAQHSRYSPIHSEPQTLALY